VLIDQFKFEIVHADSRRVHLVRVVKMSVSEVTD